MSVGRGAGPHFTRPSFLVDVEEADDGGVEGGSPGGRNDTNITAVQVEFCRGSVGSGRGIGGL